MSDTDERSSPGTAQPARISKAGCGIRFEEDELQEGIDFSGAAGLRSASDDPQSTAESGVGEHRQLNPHP